MTRPAILDRLRGVQQTGKGWVAFCPHHADRVKRSLSVKLTEDGRTLLHCFVGCSVEQVVAAVNMTLADLAPPTGNDQRLSQRRTPLTLETFARSKGLPVEFLREHGVREDGVSLLITYRLRKGSLATRQRRRSALAAGDGSSWDGPKGHAPVAYGLWKLDDAMEKGELLLVEGETDALTAWAHNIPCLGIPGADMTKVLTADALQGIEQLYVLQEPDRGGEIFVRGISSRINEFGWPGQAFAVRLSVKDLNELHVIAGERFADELLKAKEAGIPLADVATPASSTFLPHADGAAEPELRREGFDFTLIWPDGVRFALTAIRDGREGVRGELTVVREGQRLSWGVWSLPSTQAREVLRKKLDAIAPGTPWGDYLEEAAWCLTEAARQGEPLVALTGTVTSATRELVPGLLYEGEPTLVFGDGDTGKSLFAIALAVTVQSGVALPCGLKPVQAVPAAYLDWETSPDTLNERAGKFAASLGIAPPPILYKRMTRPLVDEVAALAAEFARRGVGCVMIDSMMFAVTSGETFYEPITAFYNALRLFAPAATLVLSHVTGEDARRGGAARPFGGAFAFNGPRLIWEAKRDKDVADATAIVFTCTKANNLPRRPDPFGLLFTSEGEGRIRASRFDLGEAAPQAMAGASLPYRLRLTLAHGTQSVEELAKTLGMPEDTVRRTLNRGREKGTFVPVANTTPQQWALGSRRCE